MEKAWDLGDFAKQLQLSPMRLLEIWAASASKYRRIEIGKKSGGIRVLHEPCAELKKFQRTMHDRVFRHVPVSSAVHGSVEGRSNVTHARVHTNACAVYILDLASAFNQATKQRVLDSFMRFNMNERAKAFIVDLVTHQGVIPQGAPTSNAIWNMICHELDLALEKFARDYGLRFTRYTDEIILSHPQHISHEVRRRIREAVKAAGFVINKAKTRYFHARHGALTVTGLSIVNGRAQLPKKELERIRGIIHRAATDRSISYGTVMSLVGYVRFVSSGYLPKGYLPKRIGAEVVRFKWYRKPND